MSGAPLLSVVVPTLGREAHLLPFLDALGRQRLPRERFETVVVFDGAAPTPAVAARLEALGARAVRLERRSGPPVARNRGAEAARGDFLVSTDDDVTPDPDWLANAARRLEADPSLDVIEGLTVKPGGRPVRVRAEEAGQYILCNLVVRRELFLRVGGFEEAFYDPANGAFFREDADLGFRLERAGAKVERALDVVVTHPVELPRFLDPLRWTRRYEMDPLLETRFPRLFHERIEVHRLGPFHVRRPIVRACLGVTSATVGALVALAAGWGAVAAGCGVLAGLAFLVVWAKWRFDVRRLPVYLLVPFAMTLALVRGALRLRGLPAARRVM